MLFRSTDGLKAAIEPRFAGVWVTGEISGYRGPHHSGHVYCTLKDSGSQISLVMWRSTASRLRFELKDGMEVNVQGNVEIYKPRGGYQLIASRVEPKGEGALQLAFRQMYERLEKEGLFSDDHKVGLPTYPRGIGLVTAPTGAAVRDMLRIIKRRDPRINVVLYPARVQGEGAKEQVAKGIRFLDTHAKKLGIDIIIAGRGGGSLEDMWAFNEELVARTIYECKTPIISAVGHEIDTSIADFVADMRAATPSEAAELAVPERDGLFLQMDGLRERLDNAARGSIDELRSTLDMLRQRLDSRSPGRLIKESVQRVDYLADNLSRSIRQLLERESQNLSHLAGRLEGLSPLGVLKRGYSVARFADGRLLDSVTKAKAGTAFVLRVSDGEVAARVE